MILFDHQTIIYGDGLQYRDFVFVKDVVQANMLAATTGGTGGEVFNIGTGSIKSSYSIIRARYSGEVIATILIPRRGI